MITAAIITGVRYFVISETLDVDSKSKRKRKRTTIGGSIKETMTMPRQIWLMMLVAILGSFASRLVMSYIPIYALIEDYLNLGATEYGFIQTVGAILTTVMSMPGVF